MSALQRADSPLSPMSNRVTHVWLSRCPPALAPERLEGSDLRAVRDNGIHDRVKSGELWNRERSLLRLPAEKAPHLASLSGLLPSLEKSALPPSGSGLSCIVPCDSNTRMIKRNRMPQFMISCLVLAEIAYIIQVAGLATVTSCMRLEINELKDDMHRMT